MAPWMGAWPPPMPSIPSHTGWRGAGYLPRRRSSTFKLMQASNQVQPALSLTGHPYSERVLWGPHGVRKPLTGIQPRQGPIPASLSLPCPFRLRQSEAGSACLTPVVWASAMRAASVRPPPCVSPIWRAAPSSAWKGKGFQDLGRPNLPAAPSRAAGLPWLLCSRLVRLRQLPRQLSFSLAFWLRSILGAAGMTPVPATDLYLIDLHTYSHVVRTCPYSNSGYIAISFSCPPSSGLQLVAAPSGARGKHQRAQFPETGGVGPHQEHGYGALKRVLLMTASPWHPSTSTDLPSPNPNAWKSVGRQGKFARSRMGSK